ncbi:glycosyltransferase [Amnibacterium flavum]|uniref:Glycosyl transferase n=1 Tax=Amnibacterium flavum TaxID=2173173 RepID=A0A2V1HW74_9MICO|nr:glycosyltransferase [Amnibacterium flavum]PVZ95350.1 glycosyl transferase [Amnibacterium flavum]
MRIAILCHMHHPIRQPYQGGTEAHTAMLADALVARGHDVTLYAKEGSESRARIISLVPADFDFVNAASPHVREQQRGFLAEAAYRSIQLIAAGRYDAVINNSLSSLPFRSLRDRPMLTVLHTPATLADVTAVLSHPLWQPSIHHGYATVSQANAVSWRHLLPQVEIVPNGIDLGRWTSTTAPRPGVAVWAARITPEKGLHVAIDAARRAGFRLEFGGPVSSPSYWAERIVPLLGDDVVHRGHLGHDELPAFLASGAAFIASPLWAEPFGLSVVEAMAVGTPVAALPNGALPEIVTPQAGALADSDDPGSLAHAIVAASGRDREAVARTASAYSVDAMVDGYESILDRLVSRSRSADGAADLQNA